MKKAIIFFVISWLASNANSQSKRLATYYCSENNESYSLNFFTGNKSYFVYTDATGKQTSFEPVAVIEKGEYQFTKTGNITASLQVKNSSDEFPNKLKGVFTLNGKKFKLVFKKDEKGIVD